MSYHLVGPYTPANHGPSLSSNLVFATPNFNLSGISGSALPPLPPMPNTNFSLTGVAQLGPTPVFGFNFAPPQPLASSVSSVALPLSDYNPSGFGVVPATATAFLKDQLPPGVKTVAVVAKAAMTGHNLANNIQRAEDAGQSIAEAAVCQTVNTLAEEVSGKVMKGFIVGGIPPYLAAATTNPALAATVPVVLPLIPDAYRGAQVVAHGVGTVAENGCHGAFEMARKLSQKEH